jgi:hypothetical protein
VRQGLQAYLERMERAVQPNEVQCAPLRDLQNAVAQAGELLKTDCPTYKPITPVVRIDAMEQRLDAITSWMASEAYRKLRDAVEISPKSAEMAKA